jgi:hypothetical protein
MKPGGEYRFYMVTKILFYIQENNYHVKVTYFSNSAYPLQFSIHIIIASSFAPISEIRIGSDDKMRGAKVGVATGDCHVFMVVTYNNGFWILWLYLLTPSFSNTLNPQEFTLTHAMSSKSVFTSHCLVSDLNNGYSSTKFSLSVSWQWISTQELQLSHSGYHHTTAHIKFSYHTLSHRWLTSSPTTNFLWLYLTDNCLTESESPATKVKVML